MCEALGCLIACVRCVVHYIVRGTNEIMFSVLITAYFQFLDCVSFFSVSHFVCFAFFFLHFYSHRISCFCFVLIFFYFSYDLKSLLAYVLIIRYFALSFSIPKHQNNIIRTIITTYLYGSTIRLCTQLISIYFSFAPKLLRLLIWSRILFVHSFGCFSFWKVHFVWLDRWSYKRTHSNTGEAL